MWFLKAIFHVVFCCMDCKQLNGFELDKKRKTIRLPDQRLFINYLCHLDDKREIKLN